MRRTAHQGFKLETENFKLPPSMNESSTQPSQVEPLDPMPQLQRILSARRGLAPAALQDPAVEAMVAPWVEDGAVCPAGRFQSAGDAVLVVSGPTGDGAAEGGSILRTTLAGLVLEGVVRSARWCGEGGLLVAAVDCLVRPTGEAASAESLGVVLQWTPPTGAAVVLEEELFGERPDHVLVTVRGEDAGRVVKQAKILGAEAVRIGTVADSGLVIRFGESQWEIPRDGLASVLS
jgi:hypothetical protein